MKSFASRLTLWLPAALSLALGTLPRHSANAATLDDVKARGKLVCISNAAYPGFGFLAQNGKFSGFDVDMCRAIAAAVLGDSTKFEIRPASGKDRFTLLVSKEGDVGLRSTTWTFSRDTTQGVGFTGTYFVDGQALMVRNSDNLHSLKDLNGGTICVAAGSDSELHIADAMAAVGATYKPLVFDDDDPLFKAYDAGKCDAITTDRSFLATYSTVILSKPESNVILDQIISKEPLSPYVRNGDDQWAKIVKWVVYALIDAEELGVTSANIEQQSKSANPVVRRLLGVEGDIGTPLGLSKSWGRQAIEQVGNYGEVYDRNFGPTTPFKLPRGPNALASKGGLLYAPPFN